MFDRYSKFILTVIAAALVTIAVQHTSSGALALGEGCGNSHVSPCYVKGADVRGLRVVVDN